MEHRNIYAKVILIGIFWLIGVGGFAQSRYWVGGAGSWNDAQHWSLTSGGKGGATVPSSSNDVIIDNNSFGVPGYITLNSDITVKSLQWYGAASSSGITGTNSITSNGIFYFSSTVSGSFSGTIYLSSTTESTASFSTSKMAASVIFTRGSRYLVLTNLLTSGKVDVQSPYINFNNRKVVANPLVKTETPLNLGSGGFLKDTQSQNGIFTITITTKNTTCIGDSDGTAEVVEVKNSTGSLTYTWYEGSNIIKSGSNQKITGLAKGIYFVQIEDGAGTVDAQQFTIYDPLDVKFTNFNITDVTCNGGSTGQISFKATGGTGSLTYSIDNGATYFASLPFSNLHAGSYNIVVKDGNGCTYSNASNPVVVNQASAIVLSVTSTNVTACFGNNDGTITATGSGGAGSLEYSIDGVTFSATTSFSGLAAGTYTITARSTTDHSCTKTATVTITQPVKMTATVAANPVSGCSVTPDGQIVISSAAGGSGSYEYSIDGGATWSAANTYTGLSAGTYNVIIRDKNNPTCTAVLNAALQVTANPALTASYTSKNITCNGSADGTITFSNPLGGSGQYQYSIISGSWSDNPAFTGLTAQVYTLTVRDKLTPTCQKILGTVTITEPTAISATLSKTDVTGCSSGNNGTVTVNAPTGGSGTYEYSLNGAAWVTTSTFSGLVAGSYSVSIRDKSNPTCFKVVGTVIIAAPTAITSTFTKVDVTGCAGNTNGSITFTSTTGGSGNYDYSINNGTSWSASPAFSNVKAGTYNLVVRDKATITCTKSLGQLNIIEPVSLAATVSSLNAGCFGASSGSITITNPSGGSGAYEYSSNGGTSWQAVGSFTSLSAGSYSVFIRDLNNPTCTKSLGTITITQTSKITGTVTGVNVTGCHGASTGSVTVSNVTGGNGGPYEYSIDNTTWKTSTVFLGLAAGTYAVYAREVATPTCVSTVGNYTVTEPAAIVISSLSPVNPTCYGLVNGSVNVTATGGTAPLMYSMGGTYQAQSLFSNVAAGTYTVSVKDAGGCTVTQSVTLTAPLKIVPNKIDVVNIGCTNTTGSIDVDPAGITGGVAPLKYSIYSGTTGTYLTTHTFNGLSAATYNVRVSDANSCESDIIATTVKSSVILDVSVGTVTDVKPCKGNATGSIQLVVKTGTAPYTYNIGAGDVTLGTTNSIDNLVAGTYNVVIKDATGCTKTLSNVVVGEPAVALSATFTKNDITACPDNGNIVITVAGGAAPYSVSKDNGVSYTSAAGTSYTYGSLSAGTYNIKVKDTNGCVFDIGAVAITAPQKLTLSTSQTDVACFGGTGSVAATATGGTSPFQFSVGSGAYQSTGNFSGLASGSYIINVKDNGGCSDSKTVVISQPASAVAATVQGYDVTCNGLNDGHIAVVASGGTPSYTITLNPGNIQQTGVSSADFTSLGKGTYTITVLDSKCTTPYTTTVTINEPAAVNIVLGTASVTQPTCATPGSISINSTVTTTPATGTTPTITYDLMQGTTVVASNTTGIFSNVSAGTYTIKAYANQCSSVTSPSIVVNSPSASSLALTVDSITDISCYGDKASVNATVSGGSLPYGAAVTVNINPTATLAFDKTTGKIAVTNLTGGSYVLTLSESGCSQTQNITIAAGPTAALTLGTPTVVKPTTATATDGSISVTASGGTPAYAFSLTPASPVNANPSTTGVFGGLGVGTYNLNAVDSKGCAAGPVSVILTNTPPAVAAVATGTNITCNGSSNGKIDVTIAGGTAPFIITVTTTATAVAPITTSNSSYSITGLAKGDYTIVVQDANSTSSTPQLVTITEPTAIAVALSNVTSVLCYGVTTGSMDVAVNGGTAPYSITWSGDNGLAGTVPGTSGTISNLTAGNYTILVTDASGCTATQTASIKGNTLIALTATSVDPTCSSPNSGKITLVASGGTTPPAYTYSIDGVTFSNTTGIFTLLGGGSYPVAVKDGVGCVSAPQTVTLTSPSTITLTSVTKTDFHCAIRGTVTAVATGGTAPITYKLLRAGSLVLITSNTTGAFVDVAAGRYVVQATDNVTACPATSSVITIAPGGTSTISEISRTVNGIKCSGETGGLTVLIKGVVGTISNQVVDVASGNTLQEGVDYNFSKVGGNPGEYTIELDKLKAGHYILQIWDDNSCPQRFEFSLSEPAVLKIDSYTSVDPKSATSNDGSITVVASGGLPPYTFSLYDDANNLITNTDDGIFTGLAPGNYVVEVKGQGDCAVSTPIITLTPQSNLTIDDIITEDPLCNNEANGSIDIYASGGVGTLQYSIDNGITFQPNKYFSNLAAGTYTVVVKDDTGVTMTQVVTLKNPDVVVLTLVNKKVPSQGTSADGNITVVATGGSGIYTISIVDKATGKEISNTLAPSVEVTFNNLYSGNYTITATDANGCSAVLDPVDLLRLTATATVKDVDCTGPNSGKIDVAIVGGNAPYKLTWQVAGGTVNGPFDVTGNAYSIDNLVVGTYTIIVTDNSGTSKTLTKDVKSTSNISINVGTITGLTCNGDKKGSVTFTVTGVLDGLVVTANGDDITATGNNGLFTAANLPGGITTITATNSSGCTDTKDVTIPEPQKLVVNAKVTAVPNVAKGTLGTIIADVTGGTPAYSYKLINLASGNTSNTQASNTFNGLDLGKYVVSVEDNVGCSAADTVNIGVMNVVVKGINPTCTNPDGAIEVSITDGAEDFRIRYFNSNSVSLGDINPAPRFHTFTPVAPGSYQVIVDDNSGASDTTDVVISPYVPAAITASKVCHIKDVKATSPSYYIELTITPADLKKYTVTCVDGDGIAYTDYNPVLKRISNVLPGKEYTITLTEDGGCPSVPYKVKVDEIANILEGKISKVNDVLCHGASTGNIVVTVTTAEAPYTVTGIGDLDLKTVHTAVNDTLKSLFADKYTVRITDANGCFIVDTATVKEPLKALTATFLADKSSTHLWCRSEADGQVYIKVEGGTPGYEFNGAVGIAFVNKTTLAKEDTVKVIQMPYGSFIYTVKDANGCSLIDKVTLTANALDANMDIVQKSLCRMFVNPDDIAANGGTIEINSITGDYSTAAKYYYAPLFKEGVITSASTPDAEGYYEFIAPQKDRIAQLQGLSYRFNIKVVDDYNGAPRTCVVVDNVDVGVNSANDFRAVATPDDTLCINSTVNYQAGYYFTDPKAPALNSNLFVRWNAEDYTVFVVDKLAQKIASMDRMVRLTTGKVIPQVLRIEKSAVDAFGKVVIDAKGIAVGCYDFDTAHVALYPYYDPSFTLDKGTLIPSKDKVGFIRVPIGTEQGIKLSFANKELAEKVKPKLNFVSPNPLEVEWLKFDPADSTNITVTGALGVDAVIKVAVIDPVNGCVDSSAIKVLPLSRINPPNAFSPNGDGFNDTWRVLFDEEILEYPQLEVLIFNRWGSLVYQAMPYKNDWNGRHNGVDLPIGTYYYVIKPHKGKLENITGSVSIIR